MNYVRSRTSGQSLSPNRQPLDDAASSIDRLNLVDQFNAVVGQPGQAIEEMQKDFVDGKMPYDEMVSYIRFCKYMIQAVQQRDTKDKLL